MGRTAHGLKICSLDVGSSVPGLSWAFRHSAFYVANEYWRIKVMGLFGPIQNRGLVFVNYLVFTILHLTCYEHLNAWRCRSMLVANRSSIANCSVWK